MFQLSAFVISLLALLSATFFPSAASSLAVAPVKVTTTQGEPPLCPGCENTSTLLGFVKPVQRVVAFTIDVHSQPEHGACHVPVNACVQKKPCIRPVTLEITTQPYPGPTPPYLSEELVSSTQNDDNSWKIWVSSTASAACGSTNNYDIIQLWQNSPTTGDLELVFTAHIKLTCSSCQNIEG